MPSGRILSNLTWAALALLLPAASAACDDDDADLRPTQAPTPTPTPFSLGTSLTIRGREVMLPQGVAYINQTPECQQEANASSDQCLLDLKMLIRGDSYILFDSDVPRVISRRIEPEDESDFRPLLQIIDGTPMDSAPTDSPGP